MLPKLNLNRVVDLVNELDQLGFTTDFSIGKLMEKEVSEIIVWVYVYESNWRDPKTCKMFCSYAKADDDLEKLREKVNAYAKQKCE